MYSVKGRVTYPIQSDWRLICGRMTQAGRAVIDQQEEAEAGASGDDLDAPFSFIGSRLRAHLLTTRKRAVVLPGGSRAPSGGGPRRACFPSLPSMGGVSRRRRRLVYRAKMLRYIGGLGGRRPPTSSTGYIPGHCLLLLPLLTNACK